jgi:hypothetical protein
MPATPKLTSTKCRINTFMSPDDGHLVAQIMERKGINVLRKIVQQIGFICKNIQPLFTTEFIQFRILFLREFLATNVMRSDPLLKGCTVVITEGLNFKNRKQFHILNFGC